MLDVVLNPLGVVAMPEKRFNESMFQLASMAGLQMYLAAMEKASWSLFPQSLEQDLALGEDFADANQAGLAE